MVRSRHWASGCALVLMAGYGLACLAIRVVNAESVNFSTGITQAQLDSAISAMQATVMATLPQPASVVPSSDTGAGAVGSSSNYMRQDSIRPSRYRSGSCVLSGGACTITWSSAFAVTPNPLGDPSIVNPNTATSRISCNWTSLSATSGVVSCKAATVTLTISLGPLTLFPNASDGLTVAGTAIPPL